MGLPILVAFTLSRTFSSPRTTPFYKLCLNKHFSSPKSKLICLCLSLLLSNGLANFILIGGHLAGLRQAHLSSVTGH